MWKKDNFTLSLIGLKSEPSFFYNGHHMKVKEHSLSNYLPMAGRRRLGCIPLCEMQTASSRFWTRVTVSISKDNNHYTIGISFSLSLSIYIYIYICVCVCVCVCVQENCCCYLEVSYLLLLIVWLKWKESKSICDFLLFSSFVLWVLTAYVEFPRNENLCITRI